MDLQDQGPDKKDEEIVSLLSDDPERGTAAFSIGWKAFK